MSNYESFFKSCEEHRDLLNSIFIAVPARPADGICIDLSMKLSMWYGEGILWGPLEDAMGGFIERTRARMAYDFINGEVGRGNEKFLLMIDNDIEPCVELPYLLARHDEPIVGGCAMSMNSAGHGMLCFTLPDINGDNRFVESESVDSIPATGLAEVEHVGTGAMCIRRDVLESFTWDWEKGDVPFFLPDRIRMGGFGNGQVMKGEDLWFCHQARKKGFKVQVDLEAHCGHRKMMRLAWPSHQRDPSKRVEDWVLPAKGMRVTPDG